MDFRSDLDSEFGDILSGEFSESMSFSGSGVPEQTFSGIFDETEEEIDVNEGGIVLAKFTRFTTHKSILGEFRIRDGYTAKRIKTGKKYRVNREPVEESEGAFLIVLKDV